MKNNALILFLQETLQRLFTKSPKFFKVWMIISGVLVLITGIPEALEALGIANIPVFWSDAINTAVAWASRAAFIMSLLTTQNTPVEVKEDGAIVTTQSAKSLPFTAADAAAKTKVE